MGTPCMVVPYDIWFSLELTTMDMCTTTDAAMQKRFVQPTIIVLADLQ